MAMQTRSDGGHGRLLLIDRDRACARQLAEALQSSLATPPAVESAPNGCA
jgi:hypothetical protein